MLGIFVQQLFGQSRGFATEDEVIIGQEFGFGVKFGAVGFHEPKAGGRGEALCECGPIFPSMPLDVLPVIHPGAFELGVVELEAEGLDEVQRRAGRGAKAGDVAGVRRDFGFKQDDIHFDKP